MARPVLAPALRTRSYSITLKQQEWFYLMDLVKATNSSSLRDLILNLAKYTPPTIEV